MTIRDSLQDVSERVFTMREALQNLALIMQAPPNSEWSELNQETWWDGVEDALETLNSASQRARTFLHIQQVIQLLNATLGDRRILTQGEDTEDSPDCVCLLTTAQVDRLSGELSSALQLFDQVEADIVILNEAVEIAPRVGNNRFTVNAVRITVFFVIQACVAHVLEVPSAAVFWSIGAAFVSVLLLIDIHNVFQERPWWVYWFSDESILSKIVNWHHYYLVLLIPSVLVILSGVVFSLHLWFLFDVLGTTAATALIVSIVLGSVTVFINFNKWRHRQHLLCPWCGEYKENRDALDVHCENEYGWSVKEGVLKYRSILRRIQTSELMKAPQSSVEFLLYFGLWYASVEFSFYLKYGDPTAFLMLLIIDAFLLFWEWRAVWSRRLDIGSRDAHAISPKSRRTARRWQLGMVFVPMILKYIIGIPLILVISTLVDESTMQLLAAILIMNEGFYLGVLVLYYRKATRGMLKDVQGWERVFSRTRSVAWVVTAIVFSLITGMLAFASALEFDKILVFGGAPTTFLAVVWSDSLYKEISRQLSANQSQELHKST